MFTPKATPESPPVIHCALPSLGLESPLESLVKKHDDGPIADRRSSCHIWFEQMDSLLPIGKPKVDAKRNLPSLEEITARVAPARSPPSMANDPALTSPTPRSYMFLGNGRDSVTVRSESEKRLDINIGRLHMPIRRRQSSNSLSDVRLSAIPSYSCPPTIEITAPAVPSTRNNARYALTESNVHNLGRANTAREMMSTIKRRTSPPPGLAHDLDQIRLKRHSAPAEMQFGRRSGFEHPNLSLPGAF